MAYASVIVSVCLRVQRNREVEGLMKQAVQNTYASVLALATSRRRGDTAMSHLSSTCSSKQGKQSRQADSHPENGEDGTGDTSSIESSLSCTPDEEAAYVSTVRLVYEYKSDKSHNRGLRVVAPSWQSACERRGNRRWTARQLLMLGPYEIVRKQIDVFWTLDNDVCISLLFFNLYACQSSSLLTCLSSCWLTA